MLKLIKLETQIKKNFFSRSQVICKIFWSNKSEKFYALLV